MKKTKLKQSLTFLKNNKSKKKASPSRKHKSVKTKKLLRSQRLFNRQMLRNRQRLIKTQRSDNKKKSLHKDKWLRRSHSKHKNRSFNLTRKSTKSWHRKLLKNNKPLKIQKPFHLNPSNLYSQTQYQNNLQILKPTHSHNPAKVQKTPPLPSSGLLPTTKAHSDWSRQDQSNNDNYELIP